MFKERMEFLRGPGGLRAASYFGLKLITRIEVFRLVCMPAVTSAAPTLPPGWRYLNLHSTQALAGLSGDTADLVAQQCGANPQQLIERGGSLHLLLSGDSLIAQLRIDHGPHCRVDSPPLDLRMAQSDAFLSNLYTWPNYRRLGAAGYLINATISDLSRQGTHRVLAHVRATNVPSLAAFKNAGWGTCGMILCTLSGRLLMAPGAASAALCIRTANSAKD